MKTNKLEKLLKLAANERVPAPSEDFAAGVMRQVRQGGKPDPDSLFDQLGNLFPRVALGAVVAIALFVALDLAISTVASADLSEDVAQVSAQWLLP